MADDYVPRPAATNTGCIVGVVLLVLLVPLLLCGLGLVGFWSYSVIEVQHPPNLQPGPVIVPAPAVEPTAEQPPVEAPEPESR